jgi:hypothetical protein
MSGKSTETSSQSELTSTGYLPEGPRAWPAISLSFVFSSQSVTYAVRVPLYVSSTTFVEVMVTPSIDRGGVTSFKHAVGGSSFEDLLAQGEVCFGDSSW